jgi:hypothetical protein
VQVLILKEACDVRLVPLSHDSAKVPMLMHNTTCAGDAAALCPAIPAGKKLTFTWKIDNFLAFKEILETRKIFSKFFTVGGCDLRIGVYESFDTLCIYLESEAQSAGDPQEGSFWVHYRIAAVSQKKAELTEWKESSICTRAWNNSVLQFIKVPDMLNRCAMRGSGRTIGTSAVSAGRECSTIVRHSHAHGCSAITCSCVPQPRARLQRDHALPRGRRPADPAACAARRGTLSRTALCWLATFWSARRGSSSATPT